MWEQKLFIRNSQTAVLATMAIISLASCAKHGENTANVTPQGTVNVESLRVGMPESTFKDATLTFVIDSKPAASSGGKTQYVSRAYNTKGGQYIVQCKDGKCFVLQVQYKTTPVSKEEAVATLQQLLPAGSPPQSKVDDSQLKDGKSATPNELIEFGDQYTGLLQFTDKTANKVNIVSAIEMSPDDLRAAMSGKPAKPHAASSKSTATAPESK